MCNTKKDKTPSKGDKYPEEALADEILKQLKNRGLTVLDVTKALDKAKDLLCLTDYTGVPALSQRWP